MVRVRYLEKVKFDWVVYFPRGPCLIWARIISLSLNLLFIYLFFSQISSFFSDFNCRSCIIEMKAIKFKKLYEEYA